MFSSSFPLLPHEFVKIKKFIGMKSFNWKSSRKIFFTFLEIFLSDIQVDQRFHFFRMRFPHPLAWNASYLRALLKLERRSFVVFASGSWNEKLFISLKEFFRSRREKKGFPTCFIFRFRYSLWKLRIVFREGEWRERKWSTLLYGHLDKKYFTPEGCK